MSEKTGGSPRFYNRKEAAQYLREHWGQRTSTKTMAKWGCQGGGPPFSYAVPVSDLRGGAPRRVRARIACAAPSAPRPRLLASESRHLPRRLRSAGGGVSDARKAKRPACKALGLLDEEGLG